MLRLSSLARVAVKVAWRRQRSEVTLIIHKPCSHRIGRSDLAASTSQRHPSIFIPITRRCLSGV
jgi:hypothetical protein